MQTQLMAHRDARENAVVVRFEGEIDMAVADEFQSQLKAGLEAASTNPPRPLILDLQAITYFGATALNGVVRCRDEGASNGVAVGMVTRRHNVVHVIQATRLDKILALYPTIDDALRSLRSAKSE